jgi:hypothetical protein
MLTGMTATALASTAPALTASGIAFYAAAATIIPVLFLALAVQGTLYQNILKAADAANQRFLANIRRPRSGVAALALILITSLFAAILLFAAVAERSAIVALYQGDATAATGNLVVTSTSALIGITAIVPAIAYLGTVIRMLRATPETASRNASPGAATSDAEPDKPDSVSI